MRCLFCLCLFSLAFAKPVLRNGTKAPYPIVLEAYRQADRTMLENLPSELRFESIDSVSLELKPSDFEDFDFNINKRTIDIIYGKKFEYLDEAKKFVSTLFGVSKGKTGELNCKYLAKTCSTTVKTGVSADSNQPVPIMNATIEPSRPGTYFWLPEANSKSEDRFIWRITSIPTIHLIPNSFFNVSLDFLEAKFTEDVQLKDLENISLDLRSSEGVMYLYGQSNDLPENSILEISLRMSDTVFPVIVRLTIPPRKNEKLYESFEVFIRKQRLSLHDKIIMGKWMANIYGQKPDTLREVQFSAVEQSKNNLTSFRAKLINVQSCPIIRTMADRIQSFTCPENIVGFTLLSENCAHSPIERRSEGFEQDSINEVDRFESTPARITTVTSLHSDSTASSDENQIEVDRPTVQPSVNITEPKVHTAGSKGGSDFDCNSGTGTPCSSRFSHALSHKLSTFLIWFLSFILLFLTIFILN